MQKLAVTVLAVAMIAMAAPATAADSETTDRNVDFLLEMMGFDTMPEGTAELMIGNQVSEVPIREAFERAAERAGDVDLRNLVAGMQAPDAQAPMGVGDVWVIEVGSGSCNPADVALEDSGLPNAGASAHVEGVSVAAQTYEGPVGSQTSPGTGSGFIYDWTTAGATGGNYADVPVTIHGKSDFFCFHLFEFYLFLPYLNGVAYVDA